MIKKEEVEKVINELNQRLVMAGSSLQLISVENNDIKLKLNCRTGDTQFKVAGKEVSMTDEVKKDVERQIKVKIKPAKIIFT
jgi:hypothetical protein